MKLIRFLLKASWQTLLIAIVAGLLSGSCNAALISLVNRSVNQALVSQALLYFVALIILTLFTGILSQFMLIHLSQTVIYQLRVKLSKNILGSPLVHLEKLGGNRLLATLTEDIQSLSHAASIIPGICIDLATVAGCLVYLVWLSGSVFLFTVAIAIVAIWGIQAILQNAHQLFMIAREEGDQLFKHFQAVTIGTKELKLHRSRQDDFLTNELQSSAAKMRQKNSRAMKLFALGDGSGQFAMFVMLGFTLFALPNLIHMTIEMRSAYILTIMYLSIPLQNLLHRLPDLSRGSIALQKIERMKLSLAHQLEGDTVSQRVSQSGQLELEQVTFLYHPEGEESGFLLGPISLSLQPGQVTYLVGGNGSGKSTLAKLITGLYVPETGAISLNGVEITDRNREWYRQHFSAIFSDFYLFDRCLGFDHATLDRDVERYLRQLQLDHKVTVKNGVLSTTNLSQGQRKRLALLIAYLEDRPIYLFDEWASDQDPYFRDFFYKQILVKLKQQGKTVLVITHDDRYFHLADQIVKLDYGKITSASVPVMS